MNLYETTFIINPQTDDATIDRHVREVANVIAAGNGTIRHEDHMGTRRLAYEIEGLTQGYYASFVFEAPPSLLPALQRHFKLNEAYIRHLTVRFEGDLEKLTGRKESEPARPSREAGVARPQPAREKPDTDTAETMSAAADEPQPEVGEDTGKIDVSAHEEEAAHGDEQPDGEKDDEEL